MPNLSSLKLELIQTDDHFRQLHEEHQAYERQLSSLASKSLLSQEDEIEEKQLKRAKLRLKDRMHVLLRQYSETAAPV